MKRKRYTLSNIELLFWVWRCLMQVRSRRSSFVTSNKRWVGAIQITICSHNTRTGFPTENSGQLVGALFYTTLQSNIASINTFVRAKIWCWMAMMWAITMAGKHSQFLTNIAKTKSWKAVSGDYSRGFSRTKWLRHLKMGSCMRRLIPIYAMILSSSSDQDELLI